MIRKFDLSGILAAVFVFFLSFDASAQMDSDFSVGGAIRIGSSTTGCNSTTKGGLRYNSTTDQFDYCNSTAWTAWLSSAPSCTIRSNNTNATNMTISCNAGETMTGGGCNSSSRQVNGTYPSAAATWRCVFNNAAASNTAYAICCAF